MVFCRPLAAGRWPEASTTGAFAGLAGEGAMVNRVALHVSLEASLGL